MITVDKLMQTCSMGTKLSLFSKLEPGCSMSKQIIKMEIPILNAELATSLKRINLIYLSVKSWMKTSYLSKFQCIKIFLVRTLTDLNLQQTSFKKLREKCWILPLGKRGPSDPEVVTSALVVCSYLLYL